MGGHTRVAIAGSTGSIGTQAIDVVRTEPDRFEVVALSAANSVGLLVEQARALRPRLIYVPSPSRATEVARLAPRGTEVLSGPEGLVALTEAPDVVVNGVVGFAGLDVTLATLAAGKRLALANKESLVSGGAVVERVWADSGAEIIPVDSEHCAVHQCLHGGGLRGGSGAPAALKRVVLTASGGPFRGRSLRELAEVTTADALAHPTWKMGPMNTVNSSTLLNKGLEVIEAHLLFGVPYEQIEVVVHPQSVIHSMVEFSDGATIAQLSMPDMRLPIGYALSYPERMAVAFGGIDWGLLTRLDFEPPDLAAFRCLSLAYQAGRTGGTAPTCLNAANEVAVESFLSGRLRWVDIASVIDKTLSSFVASEPRDAADILAADAEARELARGAVAESWSSRG